MFDGLKNIGSMMEMMKNAKQMQEKMRTVQEELAKRSVTAEAGGGFVTATVNGQLQLLALKIDPGKLTSANLSLLEDVIVSAVRMAQDKAAQMLQQEMQKVAGDMGLPPGLMP